MAIGDGDPACDHVIVQLERVRVLMLLNVIAVGIMVSVGAYSPRYSRHPFIRLLFLGATTLFLPIISYVSSTVTIYQHFITSQPLYSLYNDKAISQAGSAVVLVLIWTGLVLVIGINTCAIVADDARGGRNVGPPTELLIKAAWVAYLAATSSTHEKMGVRIMMVQLFAIVFTKLLFKYSMYYMARRSFALGRSPAVIAGYMAHHHQMEMGESQKTPLDQQAADDEHAAQSVPALVVMGEQNLKVEEHRHHGCFFIKEGTTHKPGQGAAKKLLTLDRVWQLDDRLLHPQFKDLCFSFALFKLLRCWFTMTKHPDLDGAGFIKARKFFRDSLFHFHHGGNNYERLFRVIKEELSFVHDYYCSSLSASYSRAISFPALSVTLSVYTVSYSLYLIVFVSREFIPQQFYGETFCFPVKEPRLKNFGNKYYDMVPIYTVVLVLLIAETRDIVSYVCSNWTKVAVIYHYINHASWQRSVTMQKCVSFALKRCRCKLVNKWWHDQIYQRSILQLYPRKIPYHVLRLLRLRNPRIKAPSAATDAVFEALKETINITEPLQQVEVGHGGLELERKFIRPPLLRSTSGPAIEIDVTSHWTDNGKLAAYSILEWHIATSIFEMNHPQPSAPEVHKIAAVHLSRYCTYLVACCSELLPGNDEWCKKLYKDVTEDADRVLSEMPGANCQQLVESLSVYSKHEVLKSGVRLGQQLMESSEIGWMELSRFWSEMILYVAPSDNFEGHVEAIARGGELITLLWALLAHAGIVGRLDVDVATHTSGLR